MLSRAWLAISIRALDVSRVADDEHDSTGVSRQPRLLDHQSMQLIQETRRVAVIPLTCKKFRDALRASSGAWKKLDYQLVLSSEQCIARCSKFFEWLLPRCTMVSSLSVIIDVAGDWDLTDDALGILQEIMSRSSQSLTRLKLALPNTIKLGVSRLALQHLTSVILVAHTLQLGKNLCEMPNLQRVELLSIPDHPASFEEGCCLPQSVTRLVLVPAPAMLPECILQLQNLQYLDIGGMFNTGLFIPTMSPMLLWCLSVMDVMLQRLRLCLVLQPPSI